MEGLQALVSLFHRSLLPLVVIHYLNIIDISLFPTEADSPLSVDKVLLIDADKQGSTSTWASLREKTDFQVVSMARENMARDALKIAADYEFTVIDGPPHAEEIARSCVIAADFVAVPIEPSGLSTWASDLTVKQVQEAQEYKEKPQMWFCGIPQNRQHGDWTANPRDGGWRWHADPDR